MLILTLAKHQSSTFSIMIKKHSPLTGGVFPLYCFLSGKIAVDYILSRFYLFLSPLSNS